MTLNSDWLRQAPTKLDEAARQAALARQAMLTKPPGALGRLEELAVHLAALQGQACPSLETVTIVVFAADHGVASAGVSAFPQAVTAEMVKNFARGGAAINVLARALGARLMVVNLGTVEETAPLEGVHALRLGSGTAHFCHAPAMAQGQLCRALEAGRAAAAKAREDGARLFIGGEMGIGNSTSAAALACALLDMPPEKLAGQGTGLDAQGMARKIAVIREGLSRHRQACGDPLQALRALGGFEIAALVGAYVAGAQVGLPVLVDGYISTVAALAAARACPGVEDWFLYAHLSAEPGHRLVLDALRGRPILDLGMRLGEGSGAGAAVPLLRLACALHKEMATFAEAGVSGKAR
ncbi:MAG: nicotinate-nucleotide--dimethylbenzimidazole phosphoribosyltransferase [Pseudomonadota bacterium]